MSGMSAMEYRRDFAGERYYASRNYCSFRHTYEAPGSNRTTVDWNLQLRQVRRRAAKPEGTAASMPNLHQGRQKELRDEEQHPDGLYHSETETVGRYQNLGNTGHMLRGLGGPANAHSIDWQLNLRDGLHRAEFATTKWRRHHARPQQSFDMMKENCGPENADFQRMHITPQDRRPDRCSGALPIATIRDDPISFHRWPGCEGTEVGQWRHLIEDRSRGCKTRRALQQETTLRGDCNRSNACIVEMLGKKKWSDARSHEPLATKLAEGGDPKLYHLSNLRVLPEENEENRLLRMSKHPRRDEVAESSTAETSKQEEPK